KAETTDPSAPIVPVLDYIITFGTDNKTGYTSGTISFTNAVGQAISITKDRVQLNTQTNTNSNLTVAAIMAPINTAKTAYFEFTYTGGIKLDFDVITWATGTTLHNNASLTVQFWVDGSWITSSNYFSSIAKTSVTTVEDVTIPIGATKI